MSYPTTTADIADTIRCQPVLGETAGVVDEMLNESDRRLFFGQRNPGPPSLGPVVTCKRCSRRHPRRAACPAQSIPSSVSNLISYVNRA
jgi:hypothetical protein